MGIFNFIAKKLKGGKHAKGTAQSVSGGCERDSRILHSIPAIREQALSDVRGISVLARACAAERGRDTGAVQEDPIRRESRALIAAAKSVGCYLDFASIPGTRYTIRSGESEVRMSQKERQYYKIKNPFAKLHLKRHPVAFVLFEHVAHNILFPESRLEFLGVTEDCHEARIVYRQGAVRSVVRPDDGQIQAALRAHGLLPEGRYEFGNASVFVTDVGEDGDNVLVDGDGRLCFIDPIIGFKFSLQEIVADTSALEAEIDQLVYKLYGLTEEEIAIVEGRGEKVKGGDEGEGCGAAKPRRCKARLPAAAIKALHSDDDEELE